MLFVAAQNFIELKNKVKMELRDRTPTHNLRHEIIEYGSLKNAWGLGPIQSKLCKKECKHCSKKTTLRPHRDITETIMN